MDVAPSTAEMPEQEQEPVRLTAADLLTNPHPAGPGATRSFRSEAACALRRAPCAL